MSAAVTLEDLVRSYALRAVKADKEGKKDEAIYYYKKAIEGLGQLITLYPDSPFRQAYEQMINEYKARIDALQRLVPANDDSEQGANVEDFIVKEKPKITFNDIVGLEEAKEVKKIASEEGENERDRGEVIELDLSDLDKEDFEDEED